MQPLYDNVLAAITLLPAGVKATLKKADVHWIVAPTLPEFDPKFSQNPSLGGTYSDRSNAVVMGVRALDPAGNNWHVLDQRLHTALHETGHAFDYVLGFYSNTEQYLRAFDEDVSALSPEKKSRYKTDLNNGAYRRKETFAELFAMKISTANNLPVLPAKSQLVKDFPHCKVLVESLLH